MSISLSGFDGFLKKFREVSSDPLLDYWADAVFVMRWQNSPLVESRFKGGRWLWLVWALLKILPHHKKKRESTALQDSSLPAQDGYRLLPTPAHLETLNPLIKRADPKSVRIYSEVADFGNHAGTVLGIDLSIADLGYLDRLGSLLRALRTHHRIARILITCLPVDPLLPKGFHPRLLEQIFTAELGLTRHRRTEARLRTLFVTYELSADSKALVLWARETGAKVVHLMHGQRLPTYQLTMATDLVLLSKIDEPWFRGRVDDKVRIHANGHPRLEKMRHEVSHTQTRTNRTQPRITFFSQPTEGDYTPDMRDADWNILTGLIGKAEVRVRLHPREPVESALRSVALIGAENFKVSDAGLLQDLEWCDAIASSWSTVSMEAAACGRGIFWTCSTPERYEASQELRDHGIGVLVEKATDWDSFLETWNCHGWAEPIIVSETRLRELGMIGDMDSPWTERLGLTTK